ncbi:MAG: hypothetical protein HYU25_12785 [Candidatus Rokubacteria bacterium]|nr:hypothetical protein [Candidatus Rokubacteria bacterium]
MAEPGRLGDLLQLRTRVRDRDEAAARAVGADGLRDAREEIPLEDVRLERADFDETMKSVFARSTLRSQART